MSDQDDKKYTDPRDPDSEGSGPDDTGREDARPDAKADGEKRPTISRHPELYMPHGRQTLRGKIREMEASRARGDMHRSDGEENRDAPSHDASEADGRATRSAAAGTSRTGSGRGDTRRVESYPTRDNRRHDPHRTKHRFDRQQTGRAEGFSADEASGASREPRRLYESETPSDTGHRRTRGEQQASGDAPYRYATSSSMGKALEQRRRSHVKRRRRRRILGTLVSLFVVILVSGVLLARYMTAGGRFNVKPNTVPHDFTLPPLSDDNKDNQGLGIEDLYTIERPKPPSKDDPDSESSDPTGEASNPTDTGHGDETEKPERTEPPVTLPTGNGMDVRNWDKDVLNVLLLGVDTRDMDNLNTRSDSMIVVTVNRKKRDVKLTSFQRDMLVYIPGHEDQGERKINEAMYFGADTAIETINYYFHLDIDDFVIVNMGGAEEIVNAVGGIKVDVPDDPEVLKYFNSIIREQNEMLEEDESKYSDYIYEGGEDIEVDGRQAIAYARMREIDDYHRMGRQQEVLMKIFEKFIHSDPITMVNTVRAAFNQMATSFTLSELTGLATELAPILHEDIGQFQVPVPGTFWEDSGSVWVNRVNYNLNIPLVHRFIYGKKPAHFEPVPVVTNAPPDLTDRRTMPEILYEEPIPAGYYPVGQEWPQLQDVEWKLPPSQDSPYWYFGPLTCR